MLLHLIQQGRHLGIRWHVVFLEAGEMPAMVRELGVGVDVFETGRIREVHNVLATARKIAHVARREKASLILSWMGAAHVYGGIAARWASLPAAWYQLDVPRSPDIIDKVAARIPARFVLTLCTDGFQAQKKLTPHTEVRLVYPGVELERFEPTLLPTRTEARQKLSLPLDRPLIGIVGRLQHWKGMHTLVAAMPRVLAKYPEALAVIVGGQHAFEPEYEGWLKEQIRAVKLEDSVQMTGFQSDIPLWMQAMDVIVHASRREPFGIVVIEAMALGKPVVATDEGGPTEIITPDQEGLLTPFEDADALAGALLRYLDQPEFAAQCGRAARERALTFSTKIYAENLVKIVQVFL
ncbi:glycosyltransferase family 4 protein [Armatimonas sp.]|uniref:glycosyltransferase family 4 protein n=1 Tax=Armatimonas sp. TaxID=1872638 RepID=UPI003751F027